MAKRIAMWSGAIIGVVVLAAVAFLLLFDWNDLRSYAGSRGSAALGRSFEIAGDLDVDLGWTTVIRAKQIRFGNAEWGSAPQMFELADLEASVRILPLLRGRLELPSLVLRQPKLLLEKDAAGEQANWDFSETPAAGTAAEATLPEKRREFPLIGRLVIEQGEVTYRDPSQQIDVSSEVNTAVGEAGGNERIELDGRGSFQGEPFRLTMQGGSLLTLRESDEPYPLTVQASIGRTNGEIRGTIAEPLDMAGLDVQLKLDGDDPAKLFPILGLPVPSTPPYSVQGRLTRDGDTWQFEDFAGRVGDSDLRGTLAVATGGERPKVRADLASRRLDFDDIAGLVGATPSTGQGETASTQQQQEAARRAADGRVIPDAPLDFERLRAVDADVRFEAKRIEAPNLPLDGVALHLKLDDGLLRLDPVRFTLANGSLAATVELDGRQDVARTAIDGQVTRIRLAELLRGTDFAEKSAGEFAGRIKVAGAGNSVRRALANADGSVSLVMNDGRFSNLLLEFAGIDVAESLGFLVTEDKSVHIRCIVSEFQLKKGILQPRILVADTTDTKLTGEGTIDLRSETLDLVLTAHPKDPSLLSARAPVLIQGQLGGVQVLPDPGTLAAKGGAAAVLGAVLTPLAALIPFIELGLGEDSHCGQLVEMARENTEKGPR